MWWCHHSPLEYGDGVVVHNQLPVLHAHLPVVTAGGGVILEHVNLWRKRMSENIKVISSLHMMGILVRFYNKYYHISTQVAWSGRVPYCMKAVGWGTERDSPCTAGRWRDRWWQRLWFPSAGRPWGPGGQYGQIWTERERLDSVQTQGDMGLLP